MRKVNDWITIQSEEDWPEEGKLIIVYLKRHDVYHIGYRVLDKSFRKLVYSNQSYLKMKSITAWKYLETYEG